jgi:predicted RNase H-like nuclease (RuvC/YqgF family)
MNTITDLLNRLKENNFINLIQELYDNHIILQNDNNKLKDENKDLESKLNKCISEYSELNKVSCIRSLSNEITQKTQYIKQLESQIERMKKQNEIKIEQTVINEFNEDEYNDIEGFELVKYKNIYYLKNINTNEIFNIVNYLPNKNVGIINSKGKIKLN